jgi:hypothetical protein
MSEANCAGWFASSTAYGAVRCAQCALLFIALYAVRESALRASFIPRNFDITNFTAIKKQPTFFVL